MSLMVGLMGAFAMTGLTSSANAATGANFVATGHDMDFHCSVAGPVEVEQECKYLKIVVDKVRNGSTLPILALDQGTELPTALANVGYTGVGEVVHVNPAETAVFDAMPFVNAKGEPLYSAIITASDETCGGCDDNEEGENSINARAADFKTYFNAGGGILALAGATRFATYYNFVPLNVGATVVSPPFEVTTEGEALGITSAEANCCATHNSFLYPPPEPFVTLEKDSAGKAETIAAFNVKITEKGFSTITTSLSGEGKSGEKITVKGGTAVTDTATLGGEHSVEATGKVEYTVYSDKECKTSIREAGAVTVSGGVVPASIPETLPPGTYYWQASYSGDEQNKPATSECGEEVETVEPGVEVTRPVLDGIASAQHYNKATAKLSTKESGDLIVAFVAADSPYTKGQISTVSGGGLTWTLVARENKALGGAEVWVARATGVLTEDPITAKITRFSPGSPAGHGYDETITVAAFKNAPGLGAVATFSSKKGAATGSLTTTKPNSWVWAIGDDWLASIPRTVPSGQTLWHQAFDSVGDTYWVQSTEGTTAEAGTKVTINDPAPMKDPFDMVLVEIL
ncbi:MAG: hypothetical protein ACHQE6_00655 [Solirubrobacterales bacterium]